MFIQYLNVACSPEPLSTVFFPQPLRHAIPAHIRAAAMLISLIFLCILVFIPFCAGNFGFKNPQRLFYIYILTLLSLLRQQTLFLIHRHNFGNGMIMPFSDDIFGYKQCTADVWLCTVYYSSVKKCLAAI